MLEIAGPTLVVLALAAGPTLAAAAVVLRARQQPRNWPVVGCCLLGSAGVGAQLLLASSAPAGRVPFVVGTAGAWLWYLAWLRSTRRGALAEQTLGVGGGLWIAGTVTVAVVLAGPGWPLRWSLGLAAVTAGGSVVAATTDQRVRSAGPVVGVFVLPAVVGRVLGPEILFVACLVWTVVTVILWSLARIEQARRGGRVRSD